MAAAVVVIARGSDHALTEPLRNAECVRANEHDAGETLERVRALGPAAVVVDVLELGEPGYELIAKLGAHDSTRHVAVLARVPAEERAIERALRLGADDFFTSDRPSVETLARIQRHVRRAAVAGRLITAQRAPSEPPSPGDARTLGRLAPASEHPPQRFQPYAEFFKNAADGVVVIDARGKILFANSTARSVLPLLSDSEELSVLDCVVPAERSRVRSIARGFAEGRFPRNVDFRVRSGAGEVVLNVNFSATLRSESAVLFTFRDVTRERETERALVQARQFLERVIDASVDAIVAADLRGNVRLFNRAASQIFGYSPDAVVGVMNVERLYPAGVAREVMKRIRDAGSGGVGRLEGYAVNMQDAAGRLVPVRISAAVIYENGEPSGTVGIFRDVREEVRMTARLKEAQETVRHHERSVALAQLAGAAAHELNQPLTVVIAYAELMNLKLDAGHPLREAAGVIGEQAERMANIVRQIGKITHYETKSYVGSAQILDLEKASTTETDG